jgi:ferredoxin-NADP reductase
MNNKNKESVNPWISRLFKQSGDPVVSVHGRVYYAHRYHERNLFGDFFSTTEKNHTALPLSSNVQPEDYQTMRSALSGSLNETNEAAGNPLIGPRLTIVNCYPETPDTKTFHLADPSGRFFDYLPGQYITLSTGIQGREYKRSYSLASSPSRSRILEITIKRAPNGGVVSNWLNDNLQVGDTVSVKGPYGKFSCTAQTSPKILMLAAGSGIVPIMSMLRWLADTDAGTDVQVLLSFRRPRDIIYKDELRLIAARHKNIKMAITLTTDEIARYHWPGLAGRVSEAMLRQTIPDLAERTVYLCGPESFMAECRKSLLRLNLPVANLHCESFTVSRPAADSEDFGVSQPERNPTGNYKIKFAKSGRTITADGLMTLLELAEKSGIAINHECRSGTCGECMIKCLKGKVKMTDQAEIDEKDRKKGWIYICCSYPATDVVLDM